MPINETVSHYIRMLRDDMQMPTHSQLYFTAIRPQLCFFENSPEEILSELIIHSINLLTVLYLLSQNT